MSKEAMKLALDWIKTDVCKRPSSVSIIKALEEALAKQEQGEPVALPLHETEEMHDAAMGVLYEGVARTNTDALWQAYRKVLVTTPQQRTWVGLTDEELSDITSGAVKGWVLKHIAIAIEAKLKEKNT